MNDYDQGTSPCAAGCGDDVIGHGRCDACWEEDDRLDAALAAAGHQVGDQCADVQHALGLARLAAPPPPVMPALPARGRLKGAA